MAMRREIIGDIREFLVRQGFRVSEEHNLRSVSFDLVARRDDLLLFLKCVTNVDAVSEDSMEELKLLSKILGGMPMIIGLHSGAGELENEVVYSRFDVPILNPSTFRMYFEDEIPPLIFAAPGGYYVHLDGDLLRKMREKRGISLGELADAAGVSRRTIQLYEEGERGTLVDVAVRIEEYLDCPLIQPVNPLKRDFELDMEGHRDMVSTIDQFFQDAFNHLLDAGCHVVSTSKSPFETLVEEKLEILLTGVGKYDRTLVKKAQVIGDVSGVVERQSVVVIDRRPRREEIGGTPLLGVKEILERGSIEEILEIIEERSKHEE